MFAEKTRGGGGVDHLDDLPVSVLQLSVVLRTIVTMVRQEH